MAGRGSVPFSARLLRILGIENSGIAARNERVTRVEERGLQGFVAVKPLNAVGVEELPAGEQLFDRFQSVLLACRLCASWSGNRRDLVFNDADGSLLREQEICRSIDAAA